MDNQPTLSIEDLRDLYFELGQIATTADDLRSRTQKTILMIMGDRDVLPCGKGLAFVREQRVRTEYTMTGLRKFFDEDQIATVTKIESTKVKALAKSEGLTKEQQFELEQEKAMTGKTTALVLRPHKD